MTPSCKALIPCYFGSNVAIRGQFFLSTPRGNLRRKATFTRKIVRTGVLTQKIWISHRPKNAARVVKMGTSNFKTLMQSRLYVII